ncbi:Kinesin light chain [Colletotrichum fructicola]|nr:Kinesin light chain [Colletotrichum fructicola]
MSDPKAYTVAWICAVTAESVAARAFLDEDYGPPQQVARHDNNSYVLGSIGSHNVVIAALPDGEYGTNSAAAVARDLVHSFPNVRIGLMVGIGGGAPSRKRDIRLGDIVVSKPGGGHGGVFQYDSGKTFQNGSFQETSFLNQPPVLLRTAVANLRATYEMKGHQLVKDVNKNLEKIKKRSKYKQPSPTSDRLYKSHIVHPLNSSDGCDIACGNDTACLIDRPERDEEDDDPAIHYGLIASGNQLMKDAYIRDKLAAERDVLCFEMEAAGLMNHFPCLVIRGICDYSDSHKNKAWQGFAAMIAAAYARDLLRQIAPDSVEAEKQIREVLDSIHEDVQRLEKTADETKTGVMTIQSHQIDHTHRLIHIEQGVQDLRLSKAEDLSTTRNPHFVVPFPSDPDFVNRPDIWTWIEEQYAGPNSRFALVGMGGFGKSQMAIHFAHKLHATSPKTSIFWVNANTKATFEESYRSIADILALPRRHDPDINILALVRKWLQREDSKILVTSRSRDAAERLTGNVKMVYTVPTMEKEQALQLLKRKLGRDINEAAALRLIRTLEYIPLAVNQAAAYIHRRSPRVTVESYLEEFHSTEQRKGTLLRSDRGDIQRYEGVSNSVVVTWQVTFEQIKREQPRAANLLSLMSYFQAQNIPEYMLHNYSSGNIVSEESDDEHGETSSDDFEDDLDMLRGYSLVTMTAMPGFLEMHSLAQFCTKVWISEYGFPDQWKTLFLQSASQHFPSGVFETWQQCQTLMPHIQPLLDKPPLEECGRLEWSELLTNVSWYLVMLGNYFRAEVIVQQAVSTRTETLGEEHPSTLTSMANLASTYRNQGRWKEAEELEVRVMETRKRVLGEEHPNTLTSMHNLVFTWKDLERWKDATQLLQECVRLTENVLGVDHTDTISSSSALSDWRVELSKSGHA